MRLSGSEITCFANRGGGGNDLIYGFAFAHGCRLKFAEDYLVGDEPGIPLVWGVLRGSDYVVKDAMASDRNYLYCDHSYFHRGHLKNYRITLNSYGLRGLRKCPLDRLKSIDINVSPWRTKGRHILVCPPTDYFMQAHGCPDWLDNTLSTLKASTDRPIIIRNKPVSNQKVPSLSDQLLNCHALVTHSSNVAVEAAVMGVPVFVHADCAASPVGKTSLEEVECPVMPDRELWLANIAYTQFSFKEILHGQVLELISDYISCERIGE